MKFKSLICALAAAAMASISADQTSSNICGWMKIASDLDAVIIGVPWVEVGTAADIKVANLVKTDNLTTGDKLYYYQNGTWSCWELGATGWTGTTTVTSDRITPAAGAAEQAITRGQALILERQSKTSPFYLYGQYKSDAVAGQTLTAGTAEAPSYTLLASPYVTAFDPNATGKITGAGADDTIVIPLNGGDQKVYQLKDNVWGYYGTETVTKGKLTIKKQVWKAADAVPAGTGFWYVSRGGTPTIAW